MSAVVDEIENTKEKLNTLEEDKNSGPRMTKEAIRKHCKEHNLYLTPYLNDILYLHFKGYSYIENLEEYVGLKCLWLENNGLLKISNLENQVELRCLYLHNNLIDKIENLDCLKNLVTINLCHNYIQKIENLSGLPVLKTLSISHNKLTSFDDICHLIDCKELSAVDLSYNQIDDQKIIEIMGAMQSLRVLNLLGNPVRNKINFYRKVLTLECKDLQYLDDRPVFPKDRVCAEAWRDGGERAEELASKKWADDEQKKLHESVMALLSLKKRKMYQSALDDELNSNDADNRERRCDTNIDSESKSEVGTSSCSSSSDEEQYSDDETEAGMERVVMPWDSRKDSGEIIDRPGKAILIEEISEQTDDQEKTIIVAANHNDNEKSYDEKIQDPLRTTPNIDERFERIEGVNYDSYLKRTEIISSQTQRCDKREKFSALMKICETIDEENENSIITPPALDYLADIPYSVEPDSPSIGLNPSFSIIELNDCENSKHVENINVESTSGATSSSSLLSNNGETDSNSDSSATSIIEVVNAVQQEKCDLDALKTFNNGGEGQENTGGNCNDINREHFNSEDDESSNDISKHQMFERLKKISESFSLTKETNNLSKSSINSLCYDGMSPEVNTFIEKIENIESGVLERIGKTRNNYAMQSEESVEAIDIPKQDDSCRHSKISFDKEDEDGCTKSNSNPMTTLNYIIDDGGCSNFELGAKKSEISNAGNEFCTKASEINANFLQNDTSNQNISYAEADEKYSTHEITEECKADFLNMHSDKDIKELEIYNEIKPEEKEEEEVVAEALSCNTISETSFHAQQTTSENNLNHVYDNVQDPPKSKNYSLELQMAVEASK
ncbi:dynein assembly factor 1, axonemal isoform X2 [Nilaparvata lugens]|uniref:dynein assembly factor 1, axonemal isoform X1 n=1 Tax=Nilaparvata lugens TaxID=108931 RepID=UPI00193EA981|nr:dynein assembly factor 1, axonemal isoform X1 [Nilaparvata lugens]XP_039299199.1 dynein assembly factor 1, axonemal isoform X2 [Nilaparvata lugens]